MAEISSNQNLVGGRLLARNVIWNLAGTAAPLLIALPAVPRLIHAMGTERFGVLTLAWAVIGYFSLFDLGLGRALTKLVAETLGDGKHEEIPPLIWTSLLTMLMLGFVGAGFFAVLTPWFVSYVLRIPPRLENETLRAFFVLCAALPIVVTSTALRGVLEAYQRFRAVSLLRASLGTLMFGSPLLVLPFSNSVLPSVEALAVSRLAAWFVNLVLCFIVVPELRRGYRIDFRFLPSLLRFGLWMTVSNVISPVLVYLDRFVIGSMVSVAAVAYYATPYEFITKLLLVPGALAAVLFPAFSTTFTRDTGNTSRLFERGGKVIFLVLFPCTLVTVALAREGLNVWLGPEFAGSSAAVLQWLAIGVFMNGLAQVPFAQVQAAGRPDLTAKLHLVQLPIYLILLFYCVTNFGIVGAAVAWTARVAVDCILLFLVAGRLLPGSAARIQRILAACVGVLPALALGMLPTTLTVKLVFLFVVCGAFAVITWFFVLTPSEKGIGMELRTLVVRD